MFVQSKYNCQPNKKTPKPRRRKSPVITQPPKITYPSPIPSRPVAIRLSKPSSAQKIIYVKCSIHSDGSLSFRQERLLSQKDTQNSNKDQIVQL